MYFKGYWSKHLYQHHSPKQLKNSFLNVDYPSLVSIAVINITIQSISRRNRSIWLTGYSPLWRIPKAGAQGRNLETEIEAEIMEECWWLPCSAFFLIQPSPTCPEMALSTVGWNHLHCLAIEKTLHRPIQWKQFLNGGFFFPGMSNSQAKSVITVSPCVFCPRPYLHF